MRITVTDLVRRPGATRHVTASLARDEFGTPAGEWGPGDEALAGAIGVDLVLEMLLDGLLVRGRVTFGTTLPCARCLTDVAADHDLAVSELYVDPARLDEDDDEVEPGYELHAEGVIDIESLVRDALLSTIPIRTLCRDDCLGLCPVCGTDRNVEDCGHLAGGAPDPRWAVLQGLQLPPG